MTARPTHLRTALAWLTAGLMAVTGWGVPVVAGDPVSVEAVDPLSTDDVRTEAETPLPLAPRPTVRPATAGCPIGDRQPHPLRLALDPGPPPVDLVILLCRFLC